MKYQFECEKIEMCEQCPCWCPNLIDESDSSDEGQCFIDFKNRDRFDSKPEDCPLKECKED